METSVDNIEYEVRNRFRFDHMSFCRTAVRRGRDGQTLKKVLAKLASAHPRLKRYQRNRGNRECLGATWHLLPLLPLEHSWLSPVAREEGNRLHEVLTGHVGADLDGQFAIDANQSVQQCCGPFAEAFSKAVTRGRILTFPNLYLTDFSQTASRDCRRIRVSMSVDWEDDLPFNLIINANSSMSVAVSTSVKNAFDDLVHWWESTVALAFGRTVTTSCHHNLANNRHRIEFEQTIDGVFFAHGSKVGCRYKTLDECLDVVEKIFRAGVERPERVECSVLTDEALYHRVREAMAPFGMPWITQFVLGYSGDAPDFWKLPEGFSEYRFPLAQWYAPPFEAIVLQVDVVHSEEGSFLEFQSVCDREDFLKLLEPAADLIGDLEWWDGPPQHRWDR